MTSEADRMTAEWPWWRVLWHRLKGHEITNSGPDYPRPVCRTCELAAIPEGEPPRRYRGSDENVR